MIIYSSSIWLENTTELGDVFSTFTYWINRKTKNSIYPDSFLDQPYRTFSDGTSLEICHTDLEYPRLYSFRFSEKDRKVPGRQWVTETGIKQETSLSDIQCSFLVQTSEISINVPSPKLTTRPWLIAEILKKCKASMRTAGLTIKTIDDLSDAEALVYEIDSPERNYPLILISPTPDGAYFVNLEKILFQTCGLAQIIQIPVGSNTFGIADILGKTRSAYNGAINILFPMMQRNGVQIVPTKLLLPDMIENMMSENISVESEVLTSISHRMNLPYYWQHITPNSVKEAQRKRDLEKHRLHLSETGNLKQYLELLEEDNQQKQAEIERMQMEIKTSQDDINFYFDEFEKADDERKSLQYKNENLLAQLESLRMSRRDRGELEECTEELRQLIEEYFADCLTPNKSLELISRLYPDRIIVLESAFKSSKESQGFLERKVVIDLLLRLATSYWVTLSEGKGDIMARQIFGENFASKEGKNLSNKGRKLRTFLYRDDEIEMLKHLKHGFKDTPAETIRIHFEWVSEEQKIIVGYCGPHLPL